MLLMTLFAVTLSLNQPATPLVLGAQANLAVPATEHRTVLDGRAWTCAPDGSCVGRGAGISQPLERECRRFAARFGVVTRYVRENVALTETELAQCNTAARAAR